MRLLKCKTLSAKLGGRSRASIFRDMRDRNFPSPLQLGVNAVAWDEEAVDAWLASLASYAPKPCATPALGKHRGRPRKLQTVVGV